MSDLRKVDRETVSNESKENQKPKNFPGLSPRSLGLDHHTLFRMLLYLRRISSYWREQRLDDNDRRLEIAYRLEPYGSDGTASYTSRSNRPLKSCTRK